MFINALFYCAHCCNFLVIIFKLYCFYLCEVNSNTFESSKEKKLQQKVLCRQQRKNYREKEGDLSRRVGKESLG